MRAVCWLFLVPTCAILAQDQRSVSEPKIPPVCRILKADLASDHGKLSEAGERRLDTSRIQQALDACSKSHSVELKADGSRNAFLSGPLDLRAGVTLLVDEGVTLFASRDPRVYDIASDGKSAGVCGVVTRGGPRGCRALLNGNQIDGAGIMGSGTIDGRGGEKLLGRNVTWWDLAEQARKGGIQNNFRILVLNRCDNFTLYKIHLKDSPNFHVAYNGGNGFTVWGVIIDAPQHARNTDGIDPGNSTNVTITHSFIRAGDDNVAIKAGAGAPTTHFTIAHNHFYYGHGMSIGSETNGGASAIRVTDLSIDGADNGIRIKSNSARGGFVHDIVYDDVCIRGTKNPLLLDTHYSGNGYVETGSKIPDFRDIVLRNVWIEGPGKITLDGYDSERRLGLTFDNVMLSAAQPVQLLAQHANIALGPGPVNFSPMGEDMNVTGKPGSGKVNSCEDKFVPFPIH
jgi:polygalacturonase